MYYAGDDNYKSEHIHDNDLILEADSIEALYEQMAKERVGWILHAEKRCKKDVRKSMEDFFVRFSNIYVEVEDFSNEKLEATKTYQERGAARDAFWKREREQQEKERQRRIEWGAKQKEERDKAEFIRLSKKFGKTF